MAYWILTVKLKVCATSHVMAEAHFINTMKSHSNMISQNENNSSATKPEEMECWNLK